MTPSSSKRHITVLGGGAFGTALAAAAVHGGNPVHLWGRNEDAMTNIQASRINEPYLGDITLPEGLTATGAWASEEVVPDVILLATPAQTVGKILGRMYRTEIYETVPVVICAKGIDQTTGKLLSELAEDAHPGCEIGILSGPSFASDIARGLPTAVSLACGNLQSAMSFAAIFSGSALRCYASDDVRGVELGGALKNVLAIAAGIVHGRALGASAQAALVTRGLVEMRRLAVALGAKAETLNGLSGLGDLILTCNSPQSRNFSYGTAVGQGEDLANRPLAEGAFTAGIATKLADENGIEVPIISTVSAVLDKRLTVDEAIAALLTRPLKTEH